MNFDHTKSAFSRKFAQLGHEEFVSNVTEELKKLCSPAPAAALSPSHRSSGYNFSDRNSDNPESVDEQDNRYMLLRTF